MLSAQAKMLCVVFAMVLVGGCGGRSDLDRGLELLASGDTDAAAKLLQRVVLESPESATAHANLGVSLVRLGEVASGIAELERARGLSSDDMRVLRWLVCAYVACERWDDARVVLDTLGTGGTDAWVLCQRAVVEHGAGNPAACRQLTAEALAA